MTTEGIAGGRTGVPASCGSTAIRNGRPALCPTRRRLSAQQNCEISHSRRRFSTGRPSAHPSGTPGRPDDQERIEGRARRWDASVAHRYPSRIILPVNTPAVASVRDLVGRRVRLPGHFVDEVTVEGARLLGSGAEILVRLPTGELDEAVLSRDDLTPSPEAEPPVKAASETGLDTARLENGVLELLRDLGLIDDDRDEVA